MRPPRELCFRAACLAFTVFSASPAAAEVVQASEEGFVVAGTGYTKAGPAFVWAELVRPARWWSKSHTWSGDSDNLSLDPQSAGCFCEDLPDGGSAEHMRVIHVLPDSLLRMKGALGPLQSEAVDAVLTIELKTTDGITSIEWTYVVGGYARFSLHDIAPAVDGVLTEQMERLGSLIDFGNPGHFDDR
jgi:uncharacterized protein YndB with AHSA1/START domain